MPYAKKTLDALDHYRHHLNASHPDLSEGQTPGIMLISCSDSRVMGDKILNPDAGNVFTHENIGGFVQPHEEADRSLDAFLHYPLLHLKGVHTIMVMGHTGCGGIKALTQSILSDAARNANDVSEWAVPLSDANITAAVKQARERGVSEDEIASAMEQIMPLRSAQRLMERTLIDGDRKMKVGDVLREKNIQVVPAVYDLKSNRLFVFDPDNKYYREPQFLIDKPKKLAFLGGSTTTTQGATIPISGLDRGIQDRLNQLSAGKQAPPLLSQ